MTIDSKMGHCACVPLFEMADTSAPGGAIEMSASNHSCKRKGVTLSKC